MNKEDAEQLLKKYRELLFHRFNDWGDDWTEQGDAEIAELEAQIIKELTDFRLPIG